MPPTSKALPVGLALTAAMLWGSYYLFVLWLPQSLDGAILAFPFLVAGVPFLILAFFRQPSAPAKVLRTMGAPTTVLAGLFLVGMQADVIVSTRLVGAVSTAILTLLGDVAFIPGMSYALYREGGDTVRRPLFWGGVVLAALGGILSIVGGGGLHGFAGWDWLIAIPLPFLVGAYFLLVARLAREAPLDPIVGSASMIAFVVAGLGSLLLTGLHGFPGSVSPKDYGLLAALGITSFFIAPLAFFESARRVGVVIPAVINAAIPIFTLLFVVSLLDQRLSWIAIVGVPVAFLGATIAVSGPDHGGDGLGGESEDSTLKDT